MVADGVFRKALNGAVLPVTEPLHPVMHALDHLTLDLRIPLVEIGVEPNETMRVRTSSAISDFADAFEFQRYVKRRGWAQTWLILRT